MLSTIEADTLDIDPNLTDEQIDAIANDVTPEGLPSGFVYLRLADATLPKRPWLISGLAMYGQVTIVVGRGGMGKSALTSHLALMVATGRDFAFWKSERRKVLIVSSEDDLDEQRRRLTAAAATLGVDSAALDGQIITLEANDDLCLIQRDGEGNVNHTELFARVERAIETAGVGLVVIDPFVEVGRGFNENSNDDVALVMSRLRQTARNHRVALLLVHHGRKGVGAGDQDSARGASALVNMARFALNLERMSVDDAKTHKVAHPERYIRVDTSKANYAARSGTKWLEVVPVDLDNGESAPTFRVAELEPTEQATGNWARSRVGPLLSLVAGEPVGGWKVSKHGKRESRLDVAIAAEFEVSEGMAGQAVAWLEANGYIRQQETRDRAQRVTCVWEPTGQVELPLDVPF